MIYITYTGNRVFENTKYYFEQTPENVIYDNCVQAAIINKYGEYLTKVFVFKTNHHKCDENFDHIAEVTKLINSNIVVEPVEYDLNDSFDTLLEKTEKLVEKNDDVIMGITNTFRHIPMSVIQILPYIQAYMDLNIRHLYYGKLIKDDEVMIQEYVQYFHYSKVIAYLQQFKDSLRVPEKLVSIGNDKLERLLKKMNSLNKQRIRSEIYHELVCLKGIYRLCVELSQEETVYKIYLMELIEDLKWTQESNFYVQMNQMGKYMMDKGYFQHAVTILDRNRAVIMSALLLGEGRIKPKTKDDLRKVAENIVKSLDGSTLKPCFEDTKLFSDKKKQEMRKIFVKLTKAQRYNKKHFTDIRNIIDHGNTFKNSAALLNVKNEIEIIYNEYLIKLNQLAELSYISLDDPEKFYVGNMKKGFKKTGGKK